MTVDDRTLEGEYLMVNASNIRMFLGGEVNLNRNAVLDDGQFEIWPLRWREWSKLAEYALEMTLEQHERDPDVTVLTGRNVAVRCSPPIQYHLDGEPAGDTPFTCRCGRKRCTFSCPTPRLMTCSPCPANLSPNDSHAPHCVTQIGGSQRRRSNRL